MCCVGMDLVKVLKALLFFTVTADLFGIFIGCFCYLAQFSGCELFLSKL